MSEPVNGEQQMSYLTTWRKLLSKTLAENNETWADVIAATLTEDELDQPFSDGPGTCQGASFTLWTSRRVYFPALYDGIEWVASVPRNPCPTKTDHVGRD